MESYVVQCYREVSFIWSVYCSYKVFHCAYYVMWKREREGGKKESCIYRESVCMCVCVCVCVRERERERERQTECERKRERVYVCVCVCEREKDRQRVREGGRKKGKEGERESMPISRVI